MEVTLLENLQMTLLLGFVINFFTVTIYLTKLYVT